MHQSLRVNFPYPQKRGRRSPCVMAIPVAVAYYTDHERIHLGDATNCLDQAHTEYVGCRSAAGLDAGNPVRTDA